METLCIQDSRALAAQTDEAELNRLVADSRTFILRCASRTCGRYVTDSDEAYETAMLAFWEAVRCYRSGSGSFQAFAAMVIRRRLLDAFDRTSRLSREIAAGHAMTWDEGEEEADGIVSEVQRAIVQDAADETARVREEIEALGEVLGDYGFSFFDLAEASPKAGKTRQSCAKAVRWMLAAAERVMNMRKTRSLPVAMISLALSIARKIIERHRRYIIAATEILDGDYPCLAEYLESIRKEQAV